MEDGSVVHDGMGYAVGQIFGVFYTENVILGSWEPAWLQCALNVLILMFWRIGLSDNGAKSNTTTFHPVEIRPGMSQGVFSWRSTGKGTT